MSNKKTQKDFYKDIIAMAKEMGRDDIVDFAEGRIEMLEKKAGSKSLLRFRLRMLLSRRLSFQ